MLNRFFADFRAQVDGNRMVGYAAVFDQVAELSTGYEALAPSAFDEALGRSTTDVRALFNHDPAFPLGRQSAGSLRLEADKQGLGFDIDLPDTQLGRDVREMVRSGLITGASFGFVPGKVAKSLASDGKQLRTHTSVAELIDVSPVTFPAYEGTAVSLRHLTFPAHPGRLRYQLIQARWRALALKGA